MCVRVYVSMYVHMMYVLCVYIRIYVCMHKCMYISMYVRLYVWRDEWMYECMQVFKKEYICIAYVCYICKQNSIYHKQQTQRSHTPHCSTSQVRSNETVQGLMGG